MATSGGLRTTGICWLTVLKARSPSAKCGQGWFLLENCSHGCLLALGDASNLSLEMHHALGGGAGELGNSPWTDKENTEALSHVPAKGSGSSPQAVSPWKWRPPRAPRPV